MKKTPRKPHGYGLVMGWLLGVELMAGGGMALGHSRSPHESARTPEINVHVYNYTQVDDQTLEQGEKEAAAIFRQAGIEVAWVNCHPGRSDYRQEASCAPLLRPAYVELRIVPGLPTVPAASHLKSMGMAIGQLASIWWPRILDEAAGANMDVAILLGMVMAHEMGHLLLGSDSHSPTGIMRPGWTREDYGLASQGPLFATQGQLLFTPRQGEQIRREVRARAQAQTSAELAAATLSK